LIVKLGGGLGTTEGKKALRLTKHGGDKAGFFRRHKKSTAGQHSTQSTGQQIFPGCSAKGQGQTKGTNFS